MTSSLQPRRRGSHGFTYVWMLAALALLSVGLAVVSERWSDQAQRERESDLLRVGTLYAKAIASYYAKSPGSARQFPADLKNLLEDNRMVGTVRHIRKLYADPLDPQRSFGLIKESDGGISGVYSQSEDAPLRSAPTDIGLLVLPAAARYSDWKFAPKVVP